MSIKEKLNKEFIFFDGAMGTMIQKYIKLSGKTPETYNIEERDIIKKIHKEYLEAGSDVITANTFGASSLKLKETGYSCEQIIKESIKIAKEAIEEYGDNKKYIALDIGPLGQLLKPMGTLDFEEAYNYFKEMIDYAEGADLIIIETMSDLLETKAAILAAKENSNLPVVASIVFDDSGKTLSGTEPSNAISILEGLKVDALGLNCGISPIQSFEIIREFIKYSSTPIIVQLNAGLPEFVDGETVFNIKEKEYAEYIKKIAELGVQVIGGCCGTTASYIKEVIKEVKTVKFKAQTEKDYTICSSYGKTIFFDNQPVIIGERINPTGKKKLKEALLENDNKYIIKEAVLQKEAGADVLDVNVGMQNINQKEKMKELICEIQSVLDIPLQIDSNNKDVIETGLRIYNGKAIINSVTGSESSMNDIFPLVSKYGGVVIGLTLDDDGIPLLAEERFEIAKRILNRALEFGIPKKDILIDTLTLTASAQQTEVIETIKTIKMVKEKLGLKTVLGVSNVSFGLPQKDVLNSVFLSMALYEGLDSCIINPLDKIMIDTIKASRVLLNVDKNSGEYINYFSNNKEIKSGEKNQNVKITLEEAIIKGLKNEATSLCKELLQTIEPLKIIENNLIPALKEVGEKYEKKIYFLPQLLQSAKAVESCFDLIKDEYENSGKKMIYKGFIVLATVKDDVHDIGKNIVKMILQNYGYKIIDLGKNVPIEDITNIVKEKNIKLLGLSALMTTTVVNMEKTIKEVRIISPDCKIVVGGAVLTKNYAKQIGSDFYAKDAMACVTIAADIFKD